MEVLKRKSGYAQDPTRYFDFERYSSICGDFILVEAAFEEANLWSHFELTDEELARIRKKKIVRLEFEEPNKFFVNDRPDNYDYQFYKIFTICPYTAKWLNKKQNNQKRVPIFFPFNKKYIPYDHKKKYDIIYTGHIVSKKLFNDLRIMSKFNYRFVSNSKHQLVTNKSVSYEEKMELISRSKITLVHNLLYPKFYHIIYVWTCPYWYDNEAFKLIPRWYKFWRFFSNKKIVVPQLKSRLFEAAFGKSIILCKKDSFNIIERYFEPEKEFVYYEDNNLEKTIMKILANYEKYRLVAESAYQRAINNYTVEKFVEKYLKDIK